MTTITSLLIQCWVAACPPCPLALKLPWTPLRRRTSTTHPVSCELNQLNNLSGKVWAAAYCVFLNTSTDRLDRSRCFPLWHQCYCLFALSLLPVATSTSVREFTVVSAERGSESFSFQLKQNITYEDCRHDNSASAPETLQITMERVFVMYVKEERILRYAITNKISPVGGNNNNNFPAG